MRIRSTKLLPVALLTAVLGLGFGVVAARAQKRGDDGQSPKIPKTATETTTINGRVVSVNDTSLTVLDGQKNEQTISLGPNTKVTKGGKDAALADLKADDSVVVVATKDENSTLTAVSITAV